MPANWKPIIQECRHFVPVIEGTHLGAGLLFSPDGLIVTNAHVVDDAGTLMVDLHDGTRAKGAMIHRDERGADLAIVRAAIHTQRFYRLPDRLADGYDDGDEVLAIGHPRGLQFTSTTGIISQRRRDFRDRPFPFVQTDVAIDKEDKLLLRYIRPCEDLDVSDVRGREPTPLPPVRREPVPVDVETGWRQSLARGSAATATGTAR